MPSAHNRRKILWVFPAYASSFGTFESASKLRGRTRAFMPPQELLVVAAYLPREWDVRILCNILVRAGLAGDYRATFWRHCRPPLRERRIEDVIHVGLVAHHPITFARAAVTGEQNASFYSAKIRRPAPVALEPLDLAH